MKKTKVFSFFTICFAVLIFPNLPIASLDNEQHNLESKNLENDRLEGQQHFSCSNIVFTNLYNVVNSNGFDVSIQCITYVMGIHLFPWKCHPKPIKTSPFGIEQTLHSTMDTE